MELIPDYKNFTVKCVQKGGNPSQIGSQLMKAGEEKILKHKVGNFFVVELYFLARRCIHFSVRPLK